MQQFKPRKIKHKIISATLGILALVFSTEVTAKTNCSINLDIFQNETVTSLINFLTEAKISKAQEKAFEITTKLAQKNPDHTIISQKVSSDRYYEDELPTKLENILDEEVKSGDLPIQNFTIRDMENAKNSMKTKSDKDVKFVIYPNFDAINLHYKDECEDGSIVNLASQFNALESPSNLPTAVKYWHYDRTQGPYCALQSVAGTKHREAAHLQGRLTDAINDMLKNCKTKDGISITEQYPNLYKGGYLNLMEIKNLDDMKSFCDFLENEDNLKDIKVLMQWVKCEGTEKKQLQFFTAAPSFQSCSSRIWESNSEIMNLRKKVCIKLVEVQYKAMAQAAAIMSAKSGKNIKLHVCMVGHGVFNNPNETVYAALKSLKEELTGTDTTVFLQVRPGSPNVWEKANATNLGINWEIFKK